MARNGIGVIGQIITDTLTFEVKYSWELVSQSVQTNSSTINWVLTTELTDSTNAFPDGLKFMCDGYYDFELTVGTNEITIDSPILVKAGTQIITQGTFVQKHADTGYQNFSVKIANSSAGLNMILTPNQYTDPTYDRIDYVTPKAATFTIDNIVRKASLVSIPSVITDEDSPTITYSNPAGNYATLLQVGMSLTTTDTNMAVPYRNISKTGNTYTFTFTSTELSNLYKKLDDRIITTKLRVFIKSTVPTINGTTTQTVVEYRDMTLNFVNYKPTLNVSLKDTSLRALDVTGNNQIFINRISDIYFNLGGKVYKDATIKHLWIQNGDNLITDVQTGYLTEITSDTFYAYIEDNRGYFATYEVKWERFIDYIPLTCRIAQSLLDVYGNITITISGKYYEGYFGAVQNSMRMEYLLREEGSNSDDWSDVQYIEPIVDLNNNYKYVFTLTDLDYNGRYELFVRVIDEVMTQTIEASTIVGAIPVFDWSKTDFAFYVPVTINDNEVPTIAAQGTSGDWSYRLWSDGTAECWARISVTTTLSNSSNAGWYSSGELYATNLTYPFTFKTIPSVTVNINPTGSTWAIIFPSNTAASTTSTGSYQLNSMSSFTSKTYQISYQVRGRWK